MMIDNARTDARLKYKFQVSFGAQKVEDQDYQAISRVEASLGYHFGNGLSANVGYLSNSAASATAIGQYLYNEWTMTIRYCF